MDKLLKTLFNLPIIRKVNMPYERKKELFLYLFFGVLTTVVSYIVFIICNYQLGIGELVSTTISWIISVVFAFFTNRIWVFCAPTKTVSAFLKQLVLFYSGRLISYGVEMLIIWGFVTMLGFEAWLIKLLANIIVIVLNYIISKVVIFKNKNIIDEVEGSDKTIS